MDRLIEQLTKGKHPIIFEARTESYEEIQDRILKVKFVFVKFTDTVGETEIGINVDADLTDIRGADFVNKTGTIHIVGTCELNYNKVVCVAEIDLKSKCGIGYLKLLG